jgi:hypothetical protein
MTTQNFDVNKLRVAKPCHVGWENMSGNEKVRFCNACELNVYNITEMTSVEINSLIQRSGGKLCGRFYKRADGTILTKDCPVGFRKYQKRVARFAGATLATILGLFSIGFGQTNSKQKKEKECKIVAPAKIFRTETKKDLNTFKGSITDVAGATIPGATVTLINNETKQKASVTTNDNGEYEFTMTTAGNYKIIFESTNFKRYEISSFVFNKNEELRIDIRLEVDGEGSVIVGFILSNEASIDPTKSSLEFTITRDMFRRMPHNK